MSLINTWPPLLEYCTVEEVDFTFDREQLPELARCCLVCKTWLYEAAPMLWAHRLDGYGSTSVDRLDVAFEEAAPSRRQLYAGLLAKADLDLGGGRCLMRPDSFNDGLPAILEFPSLVRLKLWAMAVRALPAFAAPNLVYLDIDPLYDPGGIYGQSEIWGSDAYDWDEFFERTLVSCG